MTPVSDTPQRSGVPLQTPTLDRLAASGLRYNRLHTTALCSPSRAALLTGRNHHSVGTGVIMEMGTGYPGYTGIVPRFGGGLAANPSDERLRDRMPSANGTTLRR